MATADLLQELEQLTTEQMDFLRAMLDSLLGNSGAA